MTTTDATAPEADDRVIRIVAALIVNAEGELLLVRKRGTTVFMQPGGKYEEGESAPEALIRELAEELGATVAPEDLVYLGTFKANAANEAGHTVDAEVFALAIEGSITPLAEIEELRWVHPSNPDGLAIAPLTIDHIIPALTEGE